MFVIIFTVVVSERYSIAAIVFGCLSFFAVGTFYMLKGKKDLELKREKDLELELP